MLAGPPDKMMPSGLRVLMAAMEMEGGSIWQ
jgi:hypothetical protein